MDIYTFGDHLVNIYLYKYKTWYKLLKEIEELLVEEKTFMTKSHKISLLLCFFKNGLKEITFLKEIGKFYKEFYSDELYGRYERFKL